MNGIRNQLGFAHQIFASVPGINSATADLNVMGGQHGQCQIV
jgi:hypothetical protein